jgi:hypothetical protein
MVGGVRPQEERDEVTLVIATSVLLFLGVLGCGVAALAAARAVVGDHGLPWIDAVLPVAVVAGLLSVAYLYRNRRP